MEIIFKDQATPLAINCVHIAVAHIIIKCTKKWIKRAAPMNCHEMRNRKRNRKTSALPATSLINKREKCFFPNKKSRKNPKKKTTHPKKSEKYVRPMARQLAARCFLHNMQQFVARPDVYNKINITYRARIQFTSISKSDSIRIWIWIRIWLACITRYSFVYSGDQSRQWI